MGVKGRREGSRQGSTCLTKDIGEASLLCQDAWSHQWPSKSPVRWGERAHTHTHTRERTARGTSEDTTNHSVQTLTHTCSTHTVQNKTSKHSFMYARTPIHTHTHTHILLKLKREKEIIMCNFNIPVEIERCSSGKNTYTMDQ